MATFVSIALGVPAGLYVASRESKQSRADRQTRRNQALGLVKQAVEANYELIDELLSMVQDGMGTPSLHIRFDSEMQRAIRGRLLIGPDLAAWHAEAEQLLTTVERDKLRVALVTYFRGLEDLRQLAPMPGDWSTAFAEGVKERLGKIKDAGEDLLQEASVEATEPARAPKGLSDRPMKS